MKMIWVYALAVCGLWTNLSNAEQNTDKTYKLRWVMAHEPVRVFERAARHFADEVKRETNGKVEIQIIDGKSLNSGRPLSADQAFQMVKEGKIEITQTYTTYLGNHNSKFWALDLPFMFKTHQHASRVLEGPAGQQLLASLQGSNMQGLAFTYSGGYMILPTANREIRSVDDLKGLKVRINNNSPVSAAYMKSLGAEPIMTSGEVTADADGFETTYPRFVDMAKVAQDRNKIINDTQHSLFLTAVLINKTAFEALPAAYQESVKRASKKAAELEREDSIKDSEQARAKYLEKGYKVVTVEGAQLARFKAAADPIYKKFEPMLGKDFIQAMHSN